MTVKTHLILLSYYFLVKATGLVDSVSARKFLEAAEKTEDRMLFFNVFRSVWERLSFLS